MTRLESLLTASQVSAENARTEISTAFGMWEAVANISFREEENVARADIVIGAQVDPWAGPLLKCFMMQGRVGR